VALRYGAPPAGLARKLARMNSSPRGSTPTRNSQCAIARRLHRPLARLTVLRRRPPGRAGDSLRRRRQPTTPGALAVSRPQVLGPAIPARTAAAPCSAPGTCQTCASCGYNTGCGWLGTSRRFLPAPARNGGCIRRRTCPCVACICELDKPTRLRGPSAKCELLRWYQRALGDQSASGVASSRSGVAPGGRG
jgi:hypothetical protein